MSAPPQGTIVVRLRSGPDLPVFAEFTLSEAEVATRVRSLDGDRRSTTIAWHAAEEAWGLSQLTVDGALDAAGLDLIPLDYVRQVNEYRSLGWGPLRSGECAEVTRSTGARSLWRCTEVGWDLVDRQSAAMASRAASAQPEQEAER